MKHISLERRFCKKRIAMLPGMAVNLAILVMLFLFCGMMLFKCNYAEAATPKLSASSLVLTEGQTYKLKLKNAKNVKWISSAKEIATVKKGKVRAVKKGTAIITAKVGRKSYKCTVTVTDGNTDMILKVNGKPVDVVWETNDSVEALKEYAKNGAIRISMSKYGGFEQVGDIGKSMVTSDKKITTEPGDIVLYSGDQLVIFYGSNSWSYTRLGKIKGMTDKELEEMLERDDVTIQLSY